MKEMGAVGSVSGDSEVVVSIYWMPEKERSEVSRCQVTRGESWRLHG